MRPIIIWIIIGAIIGGIVIGSIQRAWFWSEAEVRLIAAGDLWNIYDQEITKEDSIEVEIKKTGRTVEVPILVPEALKPPVQEYKFGVRYQDIWEIQGRAYCNDLIDGGIKIDRIRLITKSKIEVLTSGEVRAEPEIPDMNILYLPDETVKAPRKTWIRLEIIAGAQVKKPYSPLLLAGFCVQRLPLIGQMPEITFGCGVFETSPVFWVGKIWGI